MKEEKGKKGSTGYELIEKDQTEMRIELEQNKMVGRTTTTIFVAMTVIICLTVITYKLIDAFSLCQG